MITYLILAKSFKIAVDFRLLAILEQIILIRNNNADYIVFQRVSVNKDLCR